MMWVMPWWLPSQGLCRLAWCPSCRKDAVLPKVRSAMLIWRLRAVLRSLRCGVGLVALGWTYVLML